MIGPTKKELEAIEAENIEKQVEEDTTPEGLKEIIDNTRNENTSDIDNTGKTWCETVSILVDGNSGSDYSKLNNADELGNTASPYLGVNKGK